MFLGWFFDRELKPRGPRSLKIVFLLFLLLGLCKSNSFALCHVIALCHEIALCHTVASSHACAYCFVILARYLCLLKQNSRSCTEKHFQSCFSFLKKLTWEKSWIFNFSNTGCKIKCSVMNPFRPFSPFRGVLSRLVCALDIVKRVLLLSPCMLNNSWKTK